MLEIFSFLQYYIAASDASAGMHTNRAATFEAGPFYFFASDKFPDAVLFDILKIFDDAHMILASISDIHPLQDFAWKNFALKAKFIFTFLKVFAVLDFAVGAGDGLIGRHDSATGTVVLFSQVRPAHAAVHTAGSDQGAFVEGLHSGG
jgi:hypothetical protein